MFRLWCLVAGPATGDGTVEVGPDTGDEVDESSQVHAALAHED